MANKMVATALQKAEENAEEMAETQNMGFCVIRNADGETSLTELVGMQRPSLVETHEMMSDIYKQVLTWVESLEVQDVEQEEDSEGA